MKTSLAILPGRQGAGIGSRFLRELAGEATRAGRPLRLTVAKDNWRALSLYIRLGFTPISQTETDLEMESRPREPVNRSVVKMTPQDVREVHLS